ncbi:MAG: hypothetical protein B7733_24950 [Myxococcales bacterium FL481]|nr:MAG: hypothetical protein B7733_24950 [Myxococcales bacterium FL481]
MQPIELNPQQVGRGLGQRVVGFLELRSQRRVGAARDRDDFALHERGLQVRQDRGLGIALVVCLAHLLLQFLAAGVDDGLRQRFDPKLSALRDFAVAVVRDRGRVGRRELDAFLAAGYSDRRVAISESS